MAPQKTEHKQSPKKVQKQNRSSDTVRSENISAEDQCTVGWTSRSRSETKRTVKRNKSFDDYITQPLKRRRSTDEAKTSETFPNVEEILTETRDTAGKSTPVDFLVTQENGQESFKNRRDSSQNALVLEENSRELSESVQVLEENGQEASENAHMITEDHELTENWQASSENTEKLSEKGQEMRRSSRSVGSRDILNKSENEDIKNVSRTSTKKKRKVLYVEGFTLTSRGRNNSGVFKCMVCSKVIKGKFGATEHRKQHMVADGKYLHCDLCCYKSRWRHDMRQHMYSHSGKRSFTDLTENINNTMCSTGEIFTSKGEATEMAGQAAAETGNIKIKTKQTTTSYLEPPKIKLFSMVKQAQKVLKKTIATPLRPHAKAKEPRSGFQCHKCGKTFQSSKLLLVHIKQHMVPLGKHVLCKRCPMLFRNKSNMYQHMAKNHQGASVNDSIDITQLKKSPSNNPGNPPCYHCPVKQCTEEFEPLQMIQDHIFHHFVGIKDFIKCSHCGRRFEFRCLAEQHIRNDHPGTERDSYSIIEKEKKPGSDASQTATEESSQETESDVDWFTCPLKVCSAVFRTPSYLREHRKQHQARDGKYICCSHCSQKFRWRDSIVRHLRKSHNIVVYRADRDWTEIESNEVAVGSQHWTNSSVGKKMFGQKVVTKSLSHSKLVKKSTVSGPSKQKTVKMSPQQKYWQCLQCQRIMFKKGEMTTHLKNDHNIAHCTENVHWLKVQDTDPQKLSAGVKVKTSPLSRANMFTGSDEGFDVKQTEENDIKVFTSKTSHDDVISGNGNPLTGQQIIVSRTSDGSTLGDLSQADDQPPLAIVECHRLTPQDFAETNDESCMNNSCVNDDCSMENYTNVMPRNDTTNSHCATNANEDIDVGKNSRTHAFCKSEVITCTECSEDFRWHSMFKVHMLKYHGQKA